MNPTTILFGRLTRLSYTAWLRGCPLRARSRQFSLANLCNFLHLSSLRCGNRSTVSCRPTMGFHTHLRLNRTWQHFRRESVSVSPNPAPIGRVEYRRGRGLHPPARCCGRASAFRRTRLHRTELGSSDESCISGRWRAPNVVKVCLARTWRFEYRVAIFDGITFKNKES